MIKYDNKKEIRKTALAFLLLFLLSASFLIISCGDKEKNEKDEDFSLVRDIARVRSKLYILDDFKKYLEFETFGNDNIKLDDETLSFYLERFVEHKALLKEAEDHKINVTDKELQMRIKDLKKIFEGAQTADSKTLELFKNKDWIEHLKETIIVNKYVELSLTSGVVITQQEETDYYNKNYRNQKPYRHYNLSQISFNDKKTAQEVKNQLNRNERKFEELARVHSITPDGKDGGAIGWFTSEQLPEYIEKAVTRLHQGEISDIIESENGYVIIRLNETEIKKAPDFYEVRDYVRQKLLQEKREAFLNEHLDKIWREKKSDKNGIVIYFENLDFTYIPTKR